MKHRYLRLTLLLTTFFTCLQYGYASSGYEYNFTVTNATYDSAVYVAYYKGMYLQIFDSAYITDKNSCKISFKGTKTMPGHLRVLLFSKTRKQFEFLPTHGLTFNCTLDFRDPVGTAQYDDSPDIKALKKHQNESKAVWSAVDSARVRLSRCKTKADSLVEIANWRIARENSQKYQNSLLKSDNKFIALLGKGFQEVSLPKQLQLDPHLPYGKEQLQYLRNHFWDVFDFNDTNLMYLPLIDFKLRNYFFNIVNQQPDSVLKAIDAFVDDKRVGPIYRNHTLEFLLKFLNSSNALGKDEVFIGLVEKYVMSNQLKGLDSATRNSYISKAQASSLTTMGKTAPQFKVTKLGGGSIDLNSIKGLADYTLIVFYDATCSHCKEEVPALDSTVKALSSKYNIQLFGVLNSQSQTEWEQFIAKHKLIERWHHARVSDNEYPTFRKDYGIYTNPVLVLIDRNGKILGKKFDHKALPRLMQDITKGTLFVD